MEALTHGRLLRWGNSYGIRLTKRDVERLGLSPGAELTVSLVESDDRLELSWSTFGSGHRNTSRDHDEVLYGPGSRR